ncbi:MAG: lytic transglycosylase domain-containing protein [Bdellovibrionales bacterium]|nr:lytic transglycosylase domain-containing protein [Bdellovibrionales bacterium]
MKNQDVHAEYDNFSLSLPSISIIVFFTIVFTIFYSVNTNTYADKIKSATPNPVEPAALKAIDEAPSLHNSTSIVKPNTSPPISEKLLIPQAVLNDPDKLVNPVFKVPKYLHPRVSFWFNVYTKWDSYNHIIHHVDYPWVVFEVVNTKKFFKNNKSYMTQVHNAKKYVQLRKKFIRNSLKQLARKKNKVKLSSFQKQLLKQIKSLPGPLNKNLKMASVNVRSQLGQKNYFEYALKNSSKYLPAMENTFKQYSLPTELTRIPFVESSFNEKAQSKVGASGIWQIMPYSGKQYLKINKFIDERNSPLKATLASAKHLKRDFKILRSWPLAITAYNHGVGSMKKAVRALNSNHYGVILNKYKSESFQFASKNFYSCFLAALHAEKYSKKIFDITRKPSLDIVKVKLNSRIRVNDLIEAAETTQKEFVQYNLDLKNALSANILLPKGFQVFLPRRLVVLLRNNLKPSNKVSKS